MKFSEAITVFDTIVANGPLGTRLKYDYGLGAILDLTGQTAGKEALAELYQGDIAVAQQHHMLLILNAATFRTSRNHLHAAGFSAPDDVRRINTQHINFIN